MYVSFEIVALFFVIALLIWLAVVKSEEQSETSLPYYFSSDDKSIVIKLHKMHKNRIDREAFLKKIYNKVNDSQRLKFYVPDIELKFEEDIDKEGYVVDFFGHSERFGPFSSKKTLVKEDSLKKLVKEVPEKCYSYYINNEDHYYVINKRYLKWLCFLKKEDYEELNTLDYLHIIASDIKQNVNDYVEDIITLNYTEKFLTNGYSSSPVMRQFVYMPFRNIFGVYETIHITDINAIMVALARESIDLKNSRLFVECLTKVLTDYEKVKNANLCNIIEDLKVYLPA